MPVRIQRKRTKGWRLPPDTVVVDRTSRYGNPFTITAAREHGLATTAEEARVVCVDAFERWLDDGGERWPIPRGEERRRSLLTALGPLRGRDVACTCDPADGLPCHGDVLLRWANAPDADPAS